MTITQNDVRLYASERMTDFADGGGRMSPTVIVDGLDNNVFPDVTDIDRLTGRASLRKVFGAVTSNDNDTYLSAHALLDDAPDDASTTAVVFTTGGLTTERAAAVAALASAALVSRTPAPVNAASATVTASWTGGSSSITLEATFLSGGGTWGNLAVFEFLAVDQAGVKTLFNPAAEVAGTAASAGAQTRAITVTGALPGSGAQTGTVKFLSVPTQRVYGVASSAAGASSGATAITVAGVLTRVDNSNPAFADSNDTLPFLRPADPVLIHSTVGMTPATVSNGQTVTTGRTDLSRLRVIGNNGVEHARFTKGIPAPTGVGCTANLTAGTVTFSDVSGMSQPVTVEHRIEEMVVVSSIAGTVLTLNRALSRAYPAGTRVSSLLMLGDLQGRVSAGFAQQAWTGVWSDGRIGGEPSADFNDTLYPIVTTNAGSIGQRWYILFTSTTTFRVIGEFVGEIATGNTGAEYAPVNPATSVPYFAIPLLGWGTGWAAGNVYRFNTEGAQAPIWALRCVAPSVPGGNDSVTVEFRGYVNA